MKFSSLLTLVAAVTAGALARSSIAFGGEIHDAVRGGNSGKVEALLRDKPNLVLSKDNHGDTPLLVAVKFGQRDIAAFLLAHNANVNAREKVVGGAGQGFTVEPSSITPLGWAALKGDIGMAELLLTNGADVNAGDNGTPLHHAVLQSRRKPTSACREMVELLLKHNAAVNARDDDGMTPLHTAANQGSREAMEVLLAHKADVNARDNDDETPLHLVAGRGYDTDKAKLLLANGADINARNKDGDTPLLLAAKYCTGDIMMAEFLIAHGADVNAKNKKGHTALTIPKDYLCPQLTELLRQHGAHN